MLIERERILWSPLCVSADLSPILLGQTAPLTGSKSEFALEMFFGLSTALQEISAAGGVHGRNLSLEALNDRSDPEQVPFEPFVF